jgi:hypothetical protein
VSELCARGYRTLRSSRKGEFFFSRDASTTAPIVAMAVRFAPDGSEQSGFTRGGHCLSNNFDLVRGRVCAVENFAFGCAKTYIEYLEAHCFVSDHMLWPAARVLASLPKFARMVARKQSLEEALVAHPEYRALSETPDSSVAHLRFLNVLACRNLTNVHREVLKFGRAKGIDLEDPVFAAAAAAEESLNALAADDNASLSHYFDARLALLDHVPHANPRFAKPEQAFGRGAMWPLIEEAWTDLCEWTVYFVRRLQLARKPDLAFTFLMLNSGKESLHSETSPHDDDWATKLPVPKGAESPLDVLLPAHSGDDAALWERLRTAHTPPRPRQRPRRAQPPGAGRLHRGRVGRRRRAQGHRLGRVGRPLPARRGQPALPAAPALRGRGAPAAAPVARGAFGGPHRARRGDRAGALAVAAVAAVARAPWWCATKKMT